MLKITKLPPKLPTHPDRKPLGAGHVAQAAPVHEALKAQDRILGHGARIVAHVGLAGGNAWQADATMVPESGEQTHPDSVGFRVVARSKVRLTPGCSLRVRAACTRSGTQMKDFVGDGWGYVGTGGQIKVSVTYDNGVDGPLSVSATMTPKASALDDGLEPGGPGEAWADLHVVLADLFPPQLFESAVVARRWSENVDAAITIYFRGGVRVVDCVVFEAPARYARDTEDDDPDYSTHLHTSGTADPLPKYPSPWPITRRSDAAGGDPSGGSLMALSVATRQAQALGPTILQWTSWSEAQDVTLTEAAPASTTSTTWINLMAPAIGSWSAAGAGWAAGSPGFARRADLAGPLELRGKVGVVPVLVRAWCRVTNNAHPGALRLHAAAHCLVELAVTSETWGWVTAPAWLECGLNGDDPRSWQLLARSSNAAAAVQVRYVSIDYAAT